MKPRPESGQHPDMATLIRIDLDDRRASRYEAGGSAIRRTHEYIHDTEVSAFDWDWIQFFRCDPPEEYTIEPGPRPTNPPAGAGTARIAA